MTYLSDNTIVQFVKVIGDWMKEENLEEIKKYQNFTMLLDKSTDESNISELCLQVKIVKEGEIQIISESYYSHHLVLCFAHLIPQFKEFENFDGLLLNLHLLLKNSNVKQSLFEEVQQTYNLSSFKLIKAAVTHWLSHSQAV